MRCHGIVKPADEKKSHTIQKLHAANAPLPEMA